MTSKSPLTVQKLCDEAAAFAETESKCGEPGLYGVTDGKRVGTCLEHKFMDHLQSNYVFNKGNSASGIDIPDLGVDIKTTSIRQPQSSCPFESPHQKIYGLGYHLIIFVYAKSDNHEEKTAHLDIAHTIFVERNRTADYQITRHLRQIAENEGNVEDISAFLQDRRAPRKIEQSPPVGCRPTLRKSVLERVSYGPASFPSAGGRQFFEVPRNLPVDDIAARKLAERILREIPPQGYLTISNALQWRLQYKRIIEYAGSIPGIDRVR